MVRIQWQDPPSACKTQVRCLRLTKQQTLFQWNLKSVLQSLQIDCVEGFISQVSVQRYISKYKSTEGKESFSEII